jgi:5'-methylthioadenosine phosphorylase
MTNWAIGIIGGSGLYDMPGLEDRRREVVEGPFGAPSDAIVTGRLAGVEVAFLPRHGQGHRLAPSEVNARANIDALKRLGCTDVLALSAVGSLREDLPPGTFVVVDQYVDRTVGRKSSFFGEGIVAHVSMAQPVCPRLSAMAHAAAGEGAVLGGTYLAMEGPQFSTAAESRLHRSWGCDVIGMTGMPEAKLAREAELPYASVCMVTDYDAWREGEAGVEVADVLAVMKSNGERARRLVKAFVEALPAVRAPSPLDTCLDGAIITAPSAWDPDALARLSAVAGRALKRR